MRFQATQHGLDQRRMKGPRRGQPLRADALLAKPGHQPVQLLLGAAHHRMGAVVGGDRQARQRVGGRRHLVLRGEHGGHRSGLGQLAHPEGALRHQAQAGFPVEHAGHARRHILAQAVAQDHVGLDPPALPQPGQGQLQREQRRLRIARVGQQLILLKQCLQQGVLELAAEPFSAVVQHLAKDRLCRIQLPAHAGVLASLPGEQPGHFGPAVGAAGPEAWRGAAGLERRQQRAGLLRGTGHQRGALVEVAAAGGQGEADVAQRGLRMVGPPCRVARGQGLQRRFVLRRQRQQVRRRRRRLGFHRRLRRHRRAFQHHVRVGAREAEGAHAGDPPRLRPNGFLLRDPHGQVGPGDVRIRVVEMEVPRDPLVLQREHDFDQAGDTGGRLQVADVGLHRAQEQRPLGVPALPKRRGGRLHFDRVAQRGSGAVRFEVVDLPGRDPRLLQRTADDPRLRRSIGHGQSAGGPVLVDRTATNHRQDAIAIALCVGQPLEHHDPAAFTASEPIGGGIKGLAAAVGRQHPRLAEGDRRRRREDHVHPAGQRQVAFASQQAPAG